MNVEVLRQFEPDRLDGVKATDEQTPIDGATQFVAPDRGDALIYEFPAGTLADADYLTADLLLDGDELSKWKLRLSEGEDGRTFWLLFGALNKCEARLRVDLDATNQNQWLYDREGAWLKPECGGERVDLEDVKRMEIVVSRTSENPTRWYQTPVAATRGEPPRLDDPALPEGALLDRFGQSKIHEWGRRVENETTILDKIRAQRNAASDYSFPDTFSEWGGWADGPDLEGSGFFRTHHDGDRWWLIDPNGNPFWSAGIDCVRSHIDARIDGIEHAIEGLPDPDGEFGEHYDDRGFDHDAGSYLNSLGLNLQRAFGTNWEDDWSKTVLGQLRRFGFNTVGNWSDWEIAREAGFPYVRPLSLEFPGTKTIYRDFPDVYAEDFHETAQTFAQPLAETKDDPAMIGYFMGNEPTWGFADETPAAGMLYTTDACATRGELADWLADRYDLPSDNDANADSLLDVWNMDVSLAEIRSGTFDQPLTDAAVTDLEEFSAVMVDEFYRVLSDACREVDPNHLNLGTRYQWVPGDWALDGMNHVDVFSINCYDEQVDGTFGDIADRLDLPVLIGEWHFGALDVGLPASGIGRVADQDARGDAYRAYLEDAAAKPWCVGAHYFTAYDHSAVGRFDGENYNIGFLDVCHQPYPIANAARESHERLYEVATGKHIPFDDQPNYLQKVF